MGPACWLWTVAAQLCILFLNIFALLQCTGDPMAKTTVGCSLAVRRPCGDRPWWASMAAQSTGKAQRQALCGHRPSEAPTREARAVLQPHATFEAWCQHT